MKEMNIVNAPFIRELCDMTDNMYRLGWNERNGGNISILLSDEEVAPYVQGKETIRDLSLSVPFPEFAGRYFVVTGTGKYFKNISKDPAFNVGLVRISEDGTCGHLLWGYTDYGTFTSEIVMHLGAHKRRLKKDPCHRVVMHAHPTATVSMTHIHDWDEKAFTKSLWSTCTECIVIFPEGVAVLPWMVSSSTSIGLASAEKFDEFRILIWALHGCTVTGSSLDEAFGLLETVEKAAQIYINVVGKQKAHIDDDMLRQVADAFHLTVRDGWL